MATLACVCCGYLTIDNRLRYGICPVCFWEKDGAGRENLTSLADPTPISVTDGRRNYKEFGACERRLLQHVREPTPEELP